MTLYKTAVIGCGRIGCGFVDDPLRGSLSTHAGAYAAAKRARLVALCDLDISAASECAGGSDVHVYTDYREMLERERPDIVSVCTPPETHERIVCDVARAPGVGAIFCEKPIATMCSAAEHMIRVCAEQNVLLTINHQRRFSPFHQEIGHFVRRERGLGKIQQVVCYYAGGVANTGSHLFDLLRLYLGEVTRARGHASLNSSRRPGDPNVDGCLWFGDVKVAVRACDPEAYAIFEVDILGTLGRLRVLSSGYRAELEMALPSQNFTGIKELGAAARPSLLRPEPNKWIYFGVRHIIECLDSDSVRPLSSGEDGLAALKIITMLKIFEEEK